MDYDILNSGSPETSMSKCPGPVNVSSHDTRNFTAVINFTAQVFTEILKGDYS